MTTLVTLASGDMRRVWELAKKTWSPYCAKHGYILKEYHDLPMPDLAPSWNKVAIMLKELACACGPVWWVDSDMTVADPNRPLEQPWMEPKQIWFSSDWNGICAGMFRATPTPWTMRLLDAALLCGDVIDDNRFGKGLGCKWEQNTFKTMVEEFPAVKCNVGLLPRDYVCDRPPGKAIVYHFGGRSNNERCELIHRLHHV